MSADQNPGVTPIVSCRSLSKWYGEVIAVNDLNLDVQPGVTALLGPNGAGKSTFIGLLTGQLRPTRGAISVFGQSAWDNPSLNRRLGLSHQYDDFYEDMSAREFIGLVARLSGMARGEARERAEATLDRVGLDPAARTRPIGGYSKGMRQRTKLAQALVHEPDLLLLDEPMTGLDPVGRHDVARLIREFAEAGKSVIVSTHILHEVEALTDRILLLAAGRIVADGDLHEIRASLEEHPYAIRIVCDRPRRLGELFISRPEVEDVSVQDEGPGVRQLTIKTRRADLVFADLPELLIRENIRVSEISCPDDNLEAVFDFLVG
jgi:ABC-2 type transport system ATP-binding protein